MGTKADERFIFLKHQYYTSLLYNFGLSKIMLPSIGLCFQSCHKLH